MTETRTVTLERNYPHPPEKVWRALTQRHLLEQWLMKSDFQPTLHHPFSFRADWARWTVVCSRSSRIRL